MKVFGANYVKYLCHRGINYKIQCFDGRVWLSALPTFFQKGGKNKSKSKNKNITKIQRSKGEWSRAEFLIFILGYKSFVYYSASVDATVALSSVEFSTFSDTFPIFSVEPSTFSISSTDSSSRFTLVKLTSV